MTTHEVPRSTSGLRVALLNKVVAASGHVAPGVDVFSAFRFTRRLFSPEAAHAADARAWDDWLYDLDVPSYDDTDFGDLPVLDLDAFYNRDRYGDR